MLCRSSDRPILPATDEIGRSSARPETPSGAYPQAVAPRAPNADPSAPASRAKRFDQCRDLLGLIVVNHVTRILDELLAPIGKRLKTRFVFVERDVAGQHRQ